MVCSPRMREPAAKVALQDGVIWANEFSQRDSGG
jgi:hypothetical protein